MKPEGVRREALKPPVTNRGVKCPDTDTPAEGLPLESLSVMVDWCQLTVKGMRPEEISEKLLRIPHFLMTNDFRGGIRGYRALMCFDDIRVYEPSGKNKDNGYQVVMAGKGCRNFEKFLVANEETWYDFLERALSYGVNFPRIDLAIDDRKTYFKIAKLARLAREGLIVTRMRVGDSHVGFSIGETGQKRGDTLYIGSRNSEFFMCFYEKGYEQVEKLGIDPDDNWNRYELRFRQERAVNLAKIMVERRDVSRIAMEALNESVRFVKKPESGKDTRVRRYDLWEPWAWFMRDVGKLKLAMKPEEKDYYERLAWLSKSVMPTLKVYLEVDKIMGTCVIQDLIDSTKLDRRHMQILESCVKQLEAEQMQLRQMQDIAQSRIKGFKEGFVDWDGRRTPFDLANLLQ